MAKRKWRVGDVAMWADEMVTIEHVADGGHVLAGFNGSDGKLTCPITELREVVAAWAKIEGGEDGEVTWEFFETLVDGNCLNVPQNEVEVTGGE